jgi:hypothetical protein
LVPHGRGVDRSRRKLVAMYDDAGFLTLSAISLIAIVGSFAALLWAAVQDGRDERASAAAGSRVKDRARGAYGSRQDRAHAP